MPIKIQASGTYGVIGSQIVTPTPTKEEMELDEFKAIFNLISEWDISTQDGPKYGSWGTSMVQRGNGSHVKAILDVIKPYIRSKKVDDILY